MRRLVIDIAGSRTPSGGASRLSALFILSSDAVVDKIYDAPAGQEAPDPITIGLSSAQEAALRDIFGKDKISGAPAWIA